MSSPIRQEDASGRHDVASGRQCIVRKLSAIASGRDRVVSRSSYVRLCVATGASIGRQYVVKQIIWRCTGDALAIFDDLAVVKTLPVHRQTSPVDVKGALMFTPILHASFSSYNIARDDIYEHGIVSLPPIGDRPKAKKCLI